MICDKAGCFYILLILKRLKMLLQFIREHIEYSLLITSIILFIDAYRQHTKIVRLANSGRVTEIVKAEKRRIVSKAFAIFIMIGFLITIL